MPNINGFAYQLCGLFVLTIILIYAFLGRKRIETDTGPAIELKIALVSTLYGIFSILTGFVKNSDARGFVALILMMTFFIAWIWGGTEYKLRIICPLPQKKESAAEKEPEPPTGDHVATLPDSITKLLNEYGTFVYEGRRYVCIQPPTPESVNKDMFAICVEEEPDQEGAYTTYHFRWSQRPIRSRGTDDGRVPPGDWSTPMWCQPYGTRYLPSTHQFT